MMSKLTFGLWPADGQVTKYSGPSRRLLSGKSSATAVVEGMRGERQR